MQDESIAEFRAEMLDVLQRDLRLPPEAILLEVTPDPVGGRPRAHLDIERSRLIDPADEPRLLASARQVVRDHIDRYGLEIVLE